MNCFEHGVATLKGQLRWHRTVGIVGGILSVGLFRNRANIMRLSGLLSEAETEASRFIELCDEAEALAVKSKTIKITK